jgi:hypothetical protein
VADQWLFFPPFFSPFLGCFARFFVIAFLGVSQEGEFKNAIKKIAENGKLPAVRSPQGMPQSAAAKKSTYT